MACRTCIQWNAFAANCLWMQTDLHSPVLLFLLLVDRLLKPVVSVVTKLAKFTLGHPSWVSNTALSLIAGIHFVPEKVGLGCLESRKVIINKKQWHFLFRFSSFFAFKIVSRQDRFKSGPDRPLDDLPFEFSSSWWPSSEVWKQFEWSLSLCLEENSLNNLPNPLLFVKYYLQNSFPKFAFADDRCRVSAISNLLHWPLRSFN